MLRNGNLSRFRGMLEVLVRAFGVFVIPTVRCQYLFKSSGCHTVSPLQLYYTHNAHKSQALLQNNLKFFRGKPHGYYPDFNPRAPRGARRGAI